MLDQIVRRVTGRLEDACVYAPVPLDDVLELTDRLRWAAHESIRLTPELDGKTDGGVMTPGIRQRHGRGCDGQGRCQCPYEAFVFSKRDGKKIRKTFRRRACRGEGLARRRASALSPQQAAGAGADHARRGRGGVARGRALRGDPHPLRRPVQAVARSARMRRRYGCGSCRSSVA